MERRNVASIDTYFSGRMKSHFVNKVKTHRGNLKHAITKTGDEKTKQELILLTKELNQFLVQLDENFQNFVNFVNSIVNAHKGLTSKRIQQFELFTADESFIGSQCVICIEDIKIGRNMMRLDCDGQHTFCQVCIEGWFANHKTCPICRHEF